MARAQPSSSSEPLPNARQFASLIIICAVLNQLPPKIYENAVEGKAVWADTSEFTIDHGFAITYVKKIAKVLLPVNTYQKRRIVRRMRLQWDICQELYRWCVKTFGPTVTFRSTKKEALDVPDALAELLAPAGAVTEALEEHQDGEEGEKIIDGAE